MKREFEARRPVLAALLVGALLPLATQSCSDSHHDDSSSGDSVPVFFELERNDLVEDANHFGVLFPGDFFLIEADIVDDGSDPFDGFAFTAGQPIHVDFIAYVDDPLSELEIGLYDPQIDDTVAFYLQDVDLVFGGVDVTSGAIDFHLVVESIFGATTYGLEIAVYSLFESTSAAPQAALAQREMPGDGGLAQRELTDDDGLAQRELTDDDGRAATLVAHGAASAGAETRARFRRYFERSAIDEEPRTVGRLYVIEVDPASAHVRRQSFDLTTR